MLFDRPDDGSQQEFEQPGSNPGPSVPAGPGGPGPTGITLNPNVNQPGAVNQPGGTPTSTVQGGAAAGGAGSTVPAFNWTPPAYGGPSRPQYNFAPVPQFSPPQFNVPTAQDAANSPGYQFRLQQGEQALQASAAAQGLLRTGGTLENILGFGQQTASQEYQNVFQRALDAYDRQYGAAKDQFTPQYNGWALKANAEQAAGLAGYQGAMNMYQFPINSELQREQMLINAALEAQQNSK